MLSSSRNNKLFLQELKSSIIDFQYKNLVNDSSLSKQLGLSEGVIGKIKSGKTTPSFSTLKKLKMGGISIPAINYNNFEKNIITNNFLGKKQIQTKNHDPP